MLLRTGLQADLEMLLQSLTGYCLAPGPVARFLPQLGGCCPGQNSGSSWYHRRWHGCWRANSRMRSYILRCDKGAAAAATSTVSAAVAPTAAITAAIADPMAAAEWIQGTSCTLGAVLLHHADWMCPGVALLPRAASCKQAAYECR